MDLTIHRSELARILAGPARIAKKQANMPLLEAVLLEAADDRLTTRAADLILGVEESAECVTRKPGRVAVAASKFAALVKQLPGEVSLKLVKDQLQIKSGTGSWKLPTIAADDFPVLPRADDAKLVATSDASELSRAIRQGSYAAIDDKNRPYLEAILFEHADDGLILVSSDGKRVATARLVCPAELDAYLLVPKPGVAEARNLADANKGKQVTIRSTATHAFFSANGTSLSVKLLDTKYLPWRKVFPSAYKQRVTLNSDMLSDAIGRVELVAASHDGGCVCLGFADSVLRVSGAGQGEGEEDIECDATAEQRIYVNPSLFVQAVDVVPDDEVVLEFSGELDPIVIKGKESTEVLSLVMPRRGG